MEGHDLPKVSQQVSGRTAEQPIPQSPVLPALAATQHSPSPTPKVVRDPGRALKQPGLPLRCPCLPHCLQ